MKFTNRHLVISVMMLLGSIAYNVWIFWGPAATPKASAAATRQSLGADAPPALGPNGAAVAMDRATLAAPPRVDLGVAPEWIRDPFTGAGAAAPAVKPAITAAPTAAAPEPVVGAILFAADRRMAIVNGRIVGVGDRVGAGVVIEIARDAVLVRGPGGDARALPLKLPRFGEKAK